MTAPFRLYGAELSPYSVKVRSYLRFKGLEFDWLPRTNGRQEEFQRYAKLPLIPVLVDANDNAMQDSTPILESLEARYSEPSATPQEPSLAFLAALLEDYADEWLNKAMFHYRWSYPDDQASAAKRITDMIFDGGEKPDGIEDAVRTRMIGRLYHVGSSRTRRSRRCCRRRASTRISQAQSMSMRMRTTTLTTTATSEAAHHAAQAALKS